MKNQQIIYPIIGLIIIVLVSVYLAINHRSTFSQITNFEQCANAKYPIGESYPRQCWTPDGRNFIEQIKPTDPSLGSITISGEIACLPKLGQGAQTLECAIGLKDANGQYYSLKNLSKIDPQYQLSINGLKVEVTGTFSPETIKGPDGNTYNMIGTIDVTSIQKK